jgi:hypothetical protein
MLSTTAILCFLVNLSSDWICTALHSDNESPEEVELFAKKVVPRVKERIRRHSAT